MSERKSVWVELMRPQGAALAAYLLGALLLLNACGSDEPAKTDETGKTTNETSTPSTVEPESIYTSNPPPLLTPSPPGRAATTTSANDLPPVVATIPPNASNRIAVTIRDPLPVSAAMLIDPQGRAIYAPRIDHDRLSYGGRSSGWPKIGIGVSGGSNSGVSTGFGIGFPLFPQTTESAGSINESRFGFEIPDVAAYNANWQHWKIHVDLNDGVNSRSFEILPPAPPLHN